MIDEQCSPITHSNVVDINIDVAELTTENIVLIVLHAVCVILSFDKYIVHVLFKHNYVCQDCHVENLSASRIVGYPKLSLLYTCILGVSFVIRFGILLHLCILFGVRYDCGDVLFFDLYFGLCAWIILDISLLIAGTVAYKQLKRIDDQFIVEKLNLNTIAQWLDINETQISVQEDKNGKRTWFEQEVAFIFKMAAIVSPVSYTVLTITMLHLCMWLMALPNDNKKGWLLINPNRWVIHKGENVIITGLTVETGCLCVATIMAVGSQPAPEYEHKHGHCNCECILWQIPQALIALHLFLLFIFDIVECDTLEWNGMNLADLLAVLFGTKLVYHFTSCCMKPC